MQVVTLKKGTLSSTRSSHSWFWTFLIIFVMGAFAAASIYVYRRKGFNTNFDVSMYFRNNELCNEFTNNEIKSLSPNHSKYPRVPPTICEKMGKNYEVINNDYAGNNYQSIDQMQNFSDEEFLADSEFNSNDPNQRLIV